MTVGATKTGYNGVELPGNSIRVVFMYKGVRHRHTLGIEPTKDNIKHAAGLRSAVVFALKTGNYDPPRENPPAPTVSDPPYLRLLEPDGAGKPGLHCQPDGA